MKNYFTYPFNKGRMENKFPAKIIYQYSQWTIYWTYKLSFFEKVVEVLCYDRR
jgi:hypothetical protein